MRPSWDEYFMEMARLVSTRATCPRASCGAVIVKNKRVLATGYNGAPAGTPHCVDVGCNLEADHCVRAIHAETNAIGQAAKYGIAIDNASIYVFGSAGRNKPCVKCEQGIVAAGIVNIYWYMDDGHVATKYVGVPIRLMTLDWSLLP